MDENLRWLFGLVVTVFLAVTGYALNAFRNLRGNMSNLDKRIDEVKDNYVRRDDFLARIEGIENAMNKDNQLLREDVSRLRDDLRHHNDRVIESIAALKQEAR